ncbi:CBS domain-containing protein [Streptomyces sp. B6B3]|uniref:CBS domain-containing protein n=1 Tax=Streptomyces sp. B6B3 TaxID=3153570 RepID=UPI00325F0CE7
MRPSVTVVGPDTTVVEAAQLMRAQGVGDVLVARNGVLVGVVTDRDITLRAVAEGMDPLTVSCQSVCTPDPVTVAPDEEVATAVRLMRRHAVRRLPVVEDGWAVGVITIGDLSGDPHQDRDPGSSPGPEGPGRHAPDGGNPGRRR